jgi:hypothetical protein
MTYSRVEQAARDNAVWCDTICCIHGTAQSTKEFLLCALLMSRFSHVAIKRGAEGTGPRTRPATW